MTSRSKRTSKVVDYAAVHNPFNDDDFSDFSPPSQKKEKTKSEDYRKNETVVEVDVDKENFQTQKTVGEKGRRQRLSLEERKFQRELDKALELSVQEPSVAQDFQGFKKGKENEHDIVTLTSSPEEPNSPQSPIFNSKNVVTRVDIHSTFSGDETEARNVSSKAKETLQDYLEEEPLPVTSRLAAKRPRKHVQFIEDDSDEWNSDIEAITTHSDDSEESDFCPSPQLKKKKKNTKSQKSKSSPRPRLSSKVLKISESNSQKPKERSPLKQTQNIYVKLATSIVRKDDEREEERASRVTTSSTLSSSSSLSAVSSFVPKSTKVSVSPSSKSICPSHVGQMRKPFKSPTIGSLSSPSTLQSSSGVSRTGLRLGLSRKAYVKPLHPNTSVK